MSLRKRASSGVKWVAASTLIITVLQFIQLAVLSRILRPQEFGLMAMVLVVVGFGQAFADMGVSNAIIHRQDVNEDHLSTLYWTNLVAGLAILLLVVGIKPLIVSFYNEPRLGDLIPWAALVFPITSIGQQFQILLQKELRFDLISRVEVVATAIGTGVAIFTAIRETGVFSLILGQLSSALSKSIMLASIGRKGWRPRLRFSRADLKGYLSFGIFQMSERSINYFNQRLDHLLIGTLLGAQALGYYTMAYSLAVQPILRINPILTNVAFPTFAKVQANTEKLRRGYLLLLRLLMFVNSPLLFGLATVAPLLLPLVFGEQWIPAVPLVHVLSFVALLRSTGNPIGSLLLAKGRADWGFKWNAALLLTQVPSIYFAAKYVGAIGVAAALLSLQIVYSIANYLVLVRGLLGPCMKAYSMAIIPALGISSLMAIVVHAVCWVATGPVAWVLALQVFTGIGVYVALNLIFRRSFLKEIRSLLFVQSR